jgi:hypothetical protein
MNPSGTTHYREMAALRYVLDNSFSQLQINQRIQADSVFSGISTFGRLPYVQCLSQRDVKFDLAFIGQ